MRVVADSVYIFLESKLAFVEDDLTEDVSGLVKVAFDGPDQRVASIKRAIAFVHEEGGHAQKLLISQVCEVLTLLH
jgi:hypothetical protein